jgi:hypothetical protein
MRYYIGWDVGTWKCTDGNRKSCDALVVIDETGKLGHYRGNLSESIQNVVLSEPERKAACLIGAWFAACKVQRGYCLLDEYYIAIDTPLGWPKAFTALLEGVFPKKWAFKVGEEDNKNPLLYRKTEQQLGAGFSVVTHSIGNQSTKVMSLVCGLEADHKTWGVWTKGNVTLLETYPKACLRSEGFVGWMEGQKYDHDIREWYRPVNKETGHRERTLKEQNDTFDAGVCACLAKAFATCEFELVRPTVEGDDGDKREGWIFYPAEGLMPEHLADKYSDVTNKPEVTTFCEAVHAYQRHIRDKKSAGSDFCAGDKTEV